MTIRNIEKHILMTEKEAADLKGKAEKAGMSEASLIRSLLKGYEPREQPDERFYECMGEISDMRRSAEGLMAKEAGLEDSHYSLLSQECRRWRDFQLMIEHEFLRPGKRDTDGGK